MFAAGKLLGVNKEYGDANERKGSNMKRLVEKLWRVFNLIKICIIRTVAHINQVVSKIKFLSRIQSLVWPDKINKGSEYKDLAPEESVDNASKYFDALDWALNNEKVKNIAVAGPYGSGKSSIIRSYIKRHPELKSISISLASFMECEQSKLIEYSEEEIEAAILKQLFYRVNYKRIPQSRYRKLYSIKLRHIYGSILLVITFFILGTMFFVENIWERINGVLENAVLNLGVSSKYVVLIGISASLLCVYIVAYIIWRCISQVQLKEVNVAEHAKISASADNESIFNKNLDEIVYFFEETGYNVVFIEDLDRFSRPEIFVKLREINTILNQYEMIRKRIVFIYAVKDDIFTETDRTKFFEYILPVIPIINSTNSGEKLLERLQDDKGNMKFDISMDYIMLIAPFIEDMRVLTNICNDFLIYRENLQGKDKLKLTDQSMFSLMIFKNVCPKDFADLQAEKGSVKAAFEAKKEIILKLKSEYEREIQKATEEIENIANEILNDVEDIKAAMLNYITAGEGAFKSINVAGKSYGYSEIMEQQFDLELLRDKGNVYYYNRSGYSDYRSFDGRRVFIGEKDYIKRCERISDGGIKRKQELQQEIENNTRQIEKIGALQLKILLEKNEAFDLLPQAVKNNKILIFMLRNGFIDENYYNYMNYFHEKSITKDDKNFILSVRNRQAEAFDYKLTRKEQLVKLLLPYEFEQKEIYNFDLLDYLLVNELHSEKCELFIRQLSDESELSWKFINEYIERTSEVKGFLRKLTEKWTGIWDYIYSRDTLTQQRKDKFLELICKYVGMDNIAILNQNENFTAYFVDNADILKRLKNVSYERMKKIIEICKVKFNKLDINGVDQRLLDFIFDNNRYNLTEAMIESIFAYKNSELIELSKIANYTSIRILDYTPLLKYVEENFEFYIDEIILGRKANTEENLDAVLAIIDEIISIEDIKQLICKEKVCLDSLKRCKFEELNEGEKLAEIWNQWMQCDKLWPSWDNIIVYWEEFGMTRTVIEFIERNVDILMLEERSLGEVQELFEEMSQSDIKEEVFERLIKKMPLNYIDISFENVKPGIIQSLFKLGYIDIAPDKVTELQEVYPELVSTYIIYNKENVLRELDNYEFDVRNIEEIIDAEEVSELEKLEFVNCLEVEKITKKIALFLANIRSVISKEQFEASWNLLDENWKYKLFLNQLTIFSKEEISDKLNNLGIEYKSLANRNRRHEERLKDTECNRKLVEYLVKIGYLTSYVEESKTEEDAVTHEKKVQNYLLCRVKKV